MSWGITLRPYELLCAVCSLGEENAVPHPLLEAVRRQPDMPVTLCCNVGDVYVYQDPGPEKDTPEGPEFNIRRDLEILHKLNLFPGATLPARILFNRVLQQIETVDGICGYGAPTSEAWRGCAKAGRGCYERGQARGIDAIIPPRTAEELAKEKAESLAAMYRAEAVAVRPHILLCAVCQYGGGTRPPYPEDNLPELLQWILREPETKITLAPHADWMMCAPCPYRQPGLNACVNNHGAGGLSNEMRDLRVLQKLGLTYGTTLPARELYRLIFTRITGTLEVCGLDHAGPSVWYTGCGAATENSEAFEVGRKQLAAELNIG